MQHTRLPRQTGFAVLAGNTRSQAAAMVIAPGESEGGPTNRHAGADQWLYVVSGEGEAIVEGETLALAAGSLLLIERGETHEIRATGEAPLVTLDLYLPPAYARDGETLPAGEAD